MNKDIAAAFGQVMPAGKHPEAQTVEDVITFKMQLLAAIGERAGQQWAEQMFQMSLNEWRVLALAKSRGPCRAGLIADLLQMDKSQTSRLMKGLLKRGLIVNRPDPEDGRAVAVEVTVEGEVVHDRFFREVIKGNERVLSPLSRDEVLALHDMLKRLLDHSRDLLEARLGREIAR